MSLITDDKNNKNSAHLYSSRHAQINCIICCLRNNRQTSCIANYAPNTDERVIAAIAAVLLHKIKCPV